jgi:hypothetical protein
MLLSACDDSQPIQVLNVKDEVASTPNPTPTPDPTPAPKPVPVPTPPPVEETPPPVEIPQLKIGRSSNGLPWKESYTLALDEMFSKTELDELFNANINQEDLVAVGCPGLNSSTFLEKKYFYIAFMAAIAEAESDYEVRSETYNPGDHTMNIGLLQVDQASADRHAGKFFNHNFNNEDLKKPEMNLKVGTLILRNQVSGMHTTYTKNRLFPSSPYYWQVIHGKKTRFLKNMRINLAGLKSCSHLVGE